MISRSAISAIVGQRPHHATGYVPCTTTSHTVILHLNASFDVYLTAPGLGKELKHVPRQDARIGR